MEVTQAKSAETALKLFRVILHKMMCLDDALHLRALNTRLLILEASLKQQ